MAAPAAAGRASPALQRQALAEGDSGYGLDDLRHAVDVFTALSHEHIALEASLILLSSPKDETLLAQKFISG